MMKKSKENDGVIWKRNRDLIKKKLINMMIKKTKMEEIESNIIQLLTSIR